MLRPKSLDQGQDQLPCLQRRVKNDATKSGSQSLVKGSQTSEGFFFDKLSTQIQRIQNPRHGLVGSLPTQQRQASLKGWYLR